MITVFNVKSDRTRDIELNEGTTVRDLKNILHASGYDVLEARAIVHRAEEDDELYGQNGGYKLREGDTVEFKTSELNIPHLEKEVTDFVTQIGAAAQEEAEEEEDCPCECPMCKCEKDDVTVTKNSDGSIVIRIAR